MSCGALQVLRRLRLKECKDLHASKREGKELWATFRRTLFGHSKRFAQSINNSFNDPLRCAGEKARLWMTTLRNCAHTHDSVQIDDSRKSKLIVYLASALRSFLDGLLLWVDTHSFHLDGFIHNTNLLNLIFYCPCSSSCSLFCIFITKLKFLCSLNWYQNWRKRIEANFVKRRDGGEEEKSVAAFAWLQLLKCLFTNIKALPAKLPEPTKRRWSWKCVSL